MQKHQVKKNDLTIRKSRNLEEKELQIDLGQSYLVFLINSTDHVVRLVRINGGKWVPTALIGRTCDSTDYNNCYDAQKYTPLVYIGCGESVKIDVAWQNPDGSYAGAGWNAFTADCTYDGGIIMLVNA